MLRNTTDFGGVTFGLEEHVCVGLDSVSYVPFTCPVNIQADDVLLLPAFSYGHNPLTVSRP